MKSGKFFIMKNGDVINIDEIIYIHLSKTEEKAFIYVKGLFHSKVEHYDKSIVLPKRLTVNLDEYDNLIKLIKSYE